MDDMAERNVAKRYYVNGKLSIPREVLLRAWEILLEAELQRRLRAAKAAPVSTGDLQ